MYLLTSYAPQLARIDLIEFIYCRTSEVLRPFIPWRGRVQPYGADWG